MKRPNISTARTFLCSALEQVLPVDLVIVVFSFLTRAVADPFSGDCSLLRCFLPLPPLGDDGELGASAS
jgi:hypothetical protein